MTRLDHKLANIRAGRYQRSDFIMSEGCDAVACYRLGRLMRFL